mgnify:CR=1 FL=1
MNDKIEVNNGSKSKWINPNDLAAYRKIGFVSVSKTENKPAKSQPKPLNLLKVEADIIEPTEEK